MAGSKSGDADGSEAAFMFVKHGDPTPADWIARHPNFIKIPATLVVRREEGGNVRRGGSQVLPTQGDESAQGPGHMRRPVSLGAPVRRRRVTPVRRLPPWSNSGDGNSPGVTTPQDVIAAYCQATQVIDQAASTYLASVETPKPVDKAIGDARERAFLRLLRWEENGDVSDSAAYHARFGGHDPMTDAEMIPYKPKKKHSSTKAGDWRPSLLPELIR